MYESIANFCRQLRLALGDKGVRWATAAVVVGLLCCLTAFADVALSLRESEVAHSRQHAGEILALDNAYRAVLRYILTSADELRTPEGAAHLSGNWSRFEAALAPVCGHLDRATAGGERLSAICADRAAFFAPLQRETMAFAAEHRPMDAATFQKLLGLRDLFNDMGTTATVATDTLFEKMTGDYGRALAVLLVSATGFLGAGVVLILLIGRASVRHHEAWRASAEAAERVRQTLDLLKETVDVLPAGVAVYDAEDRLMLFNSMAAAITPVLGKPGAIGETYADLEGEKGGPRQRRTADDRWFEWSEKATPGGRTVGLRVDITDLKRHEFELERIRAEYASLVDSLSDVVFKLDMKSGKLLFVGAAAADLFGVPAESLVGEKLQDYILPQESESSASAPFDLSRHDAREQQRRFRVRAADGQLKHVEARFRGLPGDRDVVTGVLRDVESQVQLAERLETERERLRSIIESSGALIVLTDRDGIILLANSEFFQVSAMAPEEAVGRSVWRCFGEDLQSTMYQRWLAEAAEHAPLEPWRYTKALQDAAGRQRFFNVTATPIADAAGVVRQIVFLGVDESARRDAEQALAEAERLAIVGEMSATVAHEVAQPLQVINLACQSALDEIAEGGASGSPDLAYVTEKLERVAQQVERGNRIVGELRAFVRGAAAEEMRLFNPVEAVRGAVELTSHVLRDAQIELSQELSDPLPEVFGHVGKLEQVLVNLINNAKDAGGSKLEIAAVKATAESGKTVVRLSVQDNGPGIKPEVAGRLFNAIVTTKPRGKGTGLGLRICRRIVEEMGGSISGGNRPEGGARFDVLLPAHAA